jgi:AraC-like DNA-binding protein
MTVIDPGETHVFITGAAPARVFAFNFYLVPHAPSLHIHDLHDNRDLLERIAERRPLASLLDLPMRDKHLLYERGSSVWERCVGLARGLRTTVNDYVVHRDPATRRACYPAYAYQAGLFLLQLVSLVAPTRFIPRVDTQTRVDPLVVAVERYLRENLSRPYCLTELARHLDRAPGYVCSHFSRMTGATIGEHLNHLRVQAACERLRQTDEPITRIALDLGFSSPQHFSAVFKREMHVTPRWYRREGFEEGTGVGLRHEG